MIVLENSNVNGLLIEGMDVLKYDGISRKSRNGSVYQARCPVASVYNKPNQRVLIHPWRDANPFFHFYESLWMLAGREDIKPLVRYVKRMETFSDDGHTMNAAYGYRWRSGFGRDQLREIVRILSKDKDDRRAVLQIWHPSLDLGTNTKDAACNMVVTFQVNHNKQLDMTVFCRSNDIIWGCYGANAVHFSMLHEYVATSIGIHMGIYTQISVNYHAYNLVYDPMYEAYKKWENNIEKSTEHDPYLYYGLGTYPIMFTSQEEWDHDVKKFVTSDGRCPDIIIWKEKFFKDVAVPIIRAHDAYKDCTGIVRYQYAREELQKCKAMDWQLACLEWLNRRQQKEFP